MKKSMLICVLCLCVAGIANAAVIADFEAPAYAVGDTIESGVIADDSGNQVLSLSGLNTNSSLDLPTPISQTADAVVFSFDAKWGTGTDGLLYNAGVGLSEMDAAGADRWDEFGPYVARDGYRDGGGSLPFDLTIPGLESFDQGVWNNYSMVLYNTTETYDLYINGILAAAGAGYRDQGTNEDLLSLSMQSSSTNNDADLRIDNVAVTIPEPATMVLLGLGGLLAARKRK